MTSNDSVALSQLLSTQAGGRLPLSTALYACNEVARLVAGEHEMSRSVAGLDVDHIRCTRSGGVVLGGARVQATDPRNDVHAVGALFYRLLTGKEATARDVVAPSHFNPGVDSELDAVILSALSPDPTQRPSSVRVLENALAAIFEELDMTPTPDELAEAVKGVPPPRRVSVVSTPIIVKPVAVKPAGATAPLGVVTKAAPFVARTPVAAKPVIQKPLAPHRPPAGWYAADAEDDEETIAEGPSWQTQERERKWMVGITVALVTVALLWALWPAPKLSRASLESTPVSKVTARR